MAMNRFNHVDVRVSNLEEAARFYEQLLPRMGFTRTRHDPEWKVYAMAGDPSAPYVALTEQRDHRPSANRIAFWAGGVEEVDELGRALVAAGARNISGPRRCPEYSPTYYAVFFEDPSGNKLEICYRES